MVKIFIHKGKYIYFVFKKKNEVLFVFKKIKLNP